MRIMTARRGLAAACALLLAAAGCERQPQEVRLADTRVAVHAVLIAEAESAAVFISRARAGGGSGEQAHFEPVTGAVVLLVNAGDTLRLSGNAPCVAHAAPGGAPAAGCYAAAVPGRIRAGRSYALVIDVADAPRIHGSTRVPLPATIRTPLDDDVLHFSRGYQPELPPTPLTLRWSSVEPIRHAELRMVPERSECVATLTLPGRHYGSLWIPVATADTTTVAPWRVDCPQPETQDRWRGALLLSLFDENYSRYVEFHGRGQSIMLQHAGSGLVGAIGVFGAVANAAVAVTFVER